MPKSKCRKSCKCAGTKTLVKFRVFKSKKDKQWYCRAVSTAFGEITFQTEGHKNKTDTVEMVHNHISAILGGLWEVEILPSTKAE